MKKYKIKRVPTKQGAYIRRRIDRNRTKAITVGLLYLVSLLVISVLACKTLLQSEYFSGGLKSFYKTLLARKTGTFGDKIRLINAVLYAITLLVLAINGLRAVTYLKNLFKVKVSRVYGLNANIDAMESIGGLFSSAHWPCCTAKLCLRPCGRCRICRSGRSHFPCRTSIPDSCGPE